MDLKILTQFDMQNLILVSIIFGIISSKYISGYIASRLQGIKPKLANIFGLLSTTQLTTTLAATFAASSVGLLDTTLTSAIVSISIITTIFGPTAVKVVQAK